MQVRDIKVKNKMIQGIEIALPNSTLVLAIAPRGYLMCGYLNKEIAEKLGDIAAIITGVKDVDDLLAKKVAEVTSEAQKLGVKIGMTGAKALEKML